MPKQHKYKSKCPSRDMIQCGMPGCKFFSYSYSLNRHVKRMHPELQKNDIRIKGSGFAQGPGERFEKWCPVYIVSIGGEEVPGEWWCVISLSWDAATTDSYLVRLDILSKCKQCISIIYIIIAWQVWDAKVSGDWGFTHASLISIVVMLSQSGWISN